MPRRNPSLQLPANRSDLRVRPILRLTPREQHPRLPRRTVHFASMVQISPAADPARRTESASNALPRRVAVTTCAVQPFSFLREILSEKTTDTEPEKKYISSIPVLDRREERRAVTLPAFPGVKIHRLWKLRPGLYCLLAWDKCKREVLLSYKNTKIRTPLPYGVIDPPTTTRATFLEIGQPEVGHKHHRVSVKWISA